MLIFKKSLEQNEPFNPCAPSPCGPNSICRVVDSRAVCSCQSNYFGSPPNCRPECVVNSDCPRDKACKQSRCFDPCVGNCGQNALCRVVNHSPICTCLSGYIGDPFERCKLERKIYSEMLTRRRLSYSCQRFTLMLSFVLLNLSYCSYNL